MTVTTEIGKARARKEDARLVTGQTNWTDNIQLPGLVHVAFLRSPLAHARIASVDVSAARGAPGVIAAFSGADFAAEQGSLPCAWPVTPDIVMPMHPPMATDAIRACASGLRRKATCTSPGSWILSVQLVCPVTSRASSLRARGLPISVVTVMMPLPG
jgi:CO/xanthine dehydrogenase Mo-binding subunit